MTKGKQHTATLEGVDLAQQHAIFKELFDQHYAQLCYFAENLINDREEARDIVADIFKRMWSIQKTFSGTENAKAFLFVSTRNACFNLLRHRQHITAYQKHIISQNDTARNEVERVFIDSEIIRKIYEQVHRLPEKCRLVFTMTYFDGMKTKDIAKQLSITPSNVATQRARAIELLKNVLTNQEFLVLSFIMIRICEHN